MLFVDQEHEVSDSSEGSHSSPPPIKGKVKRVERDTRNGKQGFIKALEEGNANGDETLEASNTSQSETEDILEERKKKKKKTKSRKDKKVTVSKAEARELREKEHTYSSNLYRVQMEELLKEVSVNRNRIKHGDDWVKSFKLFMSKQRPQTFQFNKLENILRDVTLPLPSEIKLPKDSTELLKWTKPSDIRITGSWASGSAVDKISCLDVAVEIPDDFFRKKDYLNHRYHIKRAIYLAYIAQLISKRGDSLSFSFENGIPTKPILLIECEKFTVKIITSGPKIFKTNRFAPNISNVRFEHFIGKPLPEGDPEFSTPNYNFTVLSDLLVNESQLLIHETINGCESYKSASMLLKIWLRQRCLDKGFGGFSGFIATAFLVHLDAIGKIDTLMTVFDVVRVFFSSLSNTDMASCGISMCAGMSLAEWFLQYDVVFLDFNGLLNYTANMSKLTFRRVQMEAKNATKLLEANKVSSFQSLFLTAVPFIINFDHILSIPATSEIEKSLRKDNEQHIIDHGGFIYPLFIQIFGQLIEKCLRGRLKLVDHVLTETPKWNISQEVPKLSSFTLNFGFVINREEAYKLVEKCESEVLMASFKELWGAKAQLRRFKDGTMCETVVFKEKKKLLLQMLMEVFQAHLDIKPSSINGFHYIDTQVEDTIERDLFKIVKSKAPRTVTFVRGKRKKVADSDDVVPFELDAISNKAIQVFDDLSKNLRALQGLPLEVSAVQGTSPILRFTSVHPTPPQTFPKSSWLTEIPPDQKIMKLKYGKSDDGCFLKVPKLLEPISVILHLETSGKWPDDIAAVDRLKSAFLMRIGQLLYSQFGLVVQIYPRYLDVLKEGFIFRVKLTYYRELTLLRQHLGPDGVLKTRDSAESLKLEKETLFLPQITTTIHSFQRQFEAFGRVCRLAKRWVASQLLLASPLKYNVSVQNSDCRFTEESIELLVAYIFMQHLPHLSPPNEGQLGFLRFLHLISSCDWKATPIILNFHEKLTSEQVAGIELDFVKRRNQLPFLFIATPEDQSGSVWTKNLEPIILFRIQLLAKQALDILTKKIISKKTIDALKSSNQIKAIFRPSTDDFDVVIHLQKSMNPRSIDSIDATGLIKFHEYIKSPDEVIPIVDFDPIQNLVAELRSAFGHLAVFLHDTYDGKFIAVVWKPNAFKEVEFSLSNVNTRKSSNANKLICNMSEVLESFELLGKGLISSIDVKKEY